jgi:cephalosporin hydroxylase
VDNPASAIEEFLREDPRFVVEDARFALNEGLVSDWVTYSPGGFLRRVT